MGTFKSKVYRDIIRKGENKTIAALIEAECHLIIIELELYANAENKYKKTTGKILTLLDEKTLSIKRRLKILTFLQKNIWILLPLRNK